MDKNNHFFENQLLGHPSALFVLFFTEMWERFSYYGMRAILVIFLTGAIIGDNPGWGWSSSSALSLLGTYALFVYLTPLAGGWLADNKIGYRNAVVIGALLMTLGHASMAFEVLDNLFLYLGLIFLIIGITTSARRIIPGPPPDGGPSIFNFLFSLNLSMAIISRSQILFFNDLPTLLKSRGPGNTSGVVVIIVAFHL